MPFSVQPQGLPTMRAGLQLALDDFAFSFRKLTLWTMARLCHGNLLAIQPTPSLPPPPHTIKPVRGIKALSVLWLQTNRIWSSFDRQNRCHCRCDCSV
jgi:hypothetical protein